MRDDSWPGREWRRGEVCNRRDIDEANAILQLQMLARRYNAYNELLRRRCTKMRKGQARRSCFAQTAEMVYNQLNRYLSKLSGVELQKAMNRTWKNDPAFTKGLSFKGRERVNKLRIHKASLNFAAIMIQKTFRAARILYWKDMRLNVIAAYALR